MIHKFIKTSDGSFVLTSEIAEGRFAQIVFVPALDGLSVTECNRNIGTWSPQSP